MPKSAALVIRANAYLLTHRTVLWLVLAVLFFVAFASFALLIPLGSAADESAHYIYSAAVVRGHVAVLEVDLPGAIENIRQYTCTAFQPELTAVCQTPFTGTGEVSADTWVGLYNPVFYAWTGIGSVILPTENGLYLARFLSAIVTSSLLAWSVSLVVRTSRNSWPMVGVFILVTPMVVYLCSVLNPSAWEVVASMGVAVAGYNLLFRDIHAARGWGENHSLLLVSGCVLLVSRGLSPLIAFVIVMLLIIGAGWARVRSAFRSRAEIAVLASLTAVGIACLAWVAVVGTNYIGVKKPDSLIHGIEGISVFLRGAFNQVQQMFGVVGWLDLAPPSILVMSWLALVILFLGFSFVVVDRKNQFMIALAVAVAVFLPAVLAGLQWGGEGWQGRYSLPFVVVAVVLAGQAAANSDVSGAVSAEGRRLVLRARRQFSWVAAVAFVIFHVTMILVTAHRYMRGESAALTAPVLWFPPFDYRVLSGLAGGALILAAALLLGAMNDSERRRSARALS